MTDEIPALSPTIAHILVTRSPLHAWTEHRLLGNKPKPPSDTMIRGKILHAIILGTEMDLVEVLDFKDYRTKAAKEARDEATAAGKVPILGEKLGDLKQIAWRIESQLELYGIDLSEGVAEERLEWHEYSEHGEVLCHGHLDWRQHDWRLIREFKTGEGSAHPLNCGNRLIDGTGAIQHAAYSRAVGILHPEVMGRVEMEFSFCETSEPFAVTPGFVTGAMSEIGASRWARAVELWGKCLATGRWPAYVEKGQRALFDAPGWAVHRELEREQGE